MAFGEMQELMIGAVERVCPDADGEFLREWWSSPATRRGVATSSRQARHARVARARRKGVIASVLLAGEDPAYTRFIFSPEFAQLRSLSADAHRAAYVVFDEARVDVVRLGRALWAHGERHLFDTARRLDQHDRDRLLSLTSAFTALLLGPVSAGAEFAEAWRSLWRRARRAGLLDQPWIRLQLAILGGYVGENSPHVDWLLDPDMRPIDRLDTWLFAARGTRASLLDVTARMIRGERVSPELCFDSAQRTRVLRDLADWVKMCMRRGSHFQNEAQALMLLTCLDELPDVTSTPGLASSLREIESVQILEKARFWQILERTPPGPARERLRELWSRSYAARR